mmetsp:Transcript_98918/g.235992  ORF Transcript_98918/g.235992 Transcript_98918/m.235992 type:complete len:520 (-) Transcript_98918:51-1610(-)
MGSCKAAVTAASVAENPLHLISWNVAGFAGTHELIKSHYGSLDAFLLRHRADVFCVQETKIKASLLRNPTECKKFGALTEEYESFWAEASNGFNGVACWVRKGLSAKATQKVLQDPLDEEGRCLMLDLGTLVVFNVYAPHVHSSSPDVVAAAAKKLRFLELLRKRAEEMRQLGKMVVVCGDLNLTYRTQDVKAQALWVKVEEGFISGNRDWPIEETNPSVVTAGSGAWIRVSEAVKALPSEVTVTAEQAKALLLEPLKRGQILKRLAKESKKENRERWEKKDTSVTLWAGESNTPLQVLEGLSAEEEVLLQFGVQEVELAVAGQPPHMVHESASVEWFSSWLADGFVDTFASCHPEAKERSTCWLRQANLRHCNMGSRLDYILCDKTLHKHLVCTPTSKLAGASEACPAHTAEAALNAATNFGRWHGAHQVQRGKEGGGLSLQQDDMKLNDSQFRLPHTGIIYTPPKYSDHIPVSACFSGLALSSSTKSPISEEANKRTRPWTSQASLGSFFTKRQKLS